MVGRLGGKSAIVTGATSGIGRVIAERFHNEGAHVLITGRDEARGKQVVHDLGSRAVFIAADIANPEAAQTLVSAAVEAFGHLDVLVNNAAIDHNASLLDASIDDMRRTFEVNTFAAVRMMQEAAKAMLQQGGSIINVTSRLATIGVPTMGIYSASKGAIRSITRTAAVELAPHDIRVNDVAPGMTATPLYEDWLSGYSDPAEKQREVVADIPLGRVANPEDVAAAVLYLASDESRYITGTTLPVDGGYTAR